MGAGDRAGDTHLLGDAWLRSIILDGRGMDGVVTPIAVLLAMTVAFALIALRGSASTSKTGWI